jgi:hypothetical protein
MSEIRSVHALAIAGATPVFVRLVGSEAVFAGSTESGSIVMLTLDDAGAEDELADDIEAGLAALQEPVVATWDSIKERLGL